MLSTKLAAVASLVTVVLLLVTRRDEIVVVPAVPAVAAVPAAQPAEPAAPAPARGGVLLAEFSGASSALAVDDHHVYAAAMLGDGDLDHAVVRVPIAGGPVERLADVGFRISAIADAGDALVVAGYRSGLPDLTIVRVGKQPPAAVTPIGVVETVGFALARHADTLYLAAGGKLYTIGAGLTELAVEPTNARGVTGLSPRVLAAGAHHLFGIDATDPSMILVLDPRGTVVDRVWAREPVRSLVWAYDETIFVVTDHVVERYAFGLPTGSLETQLQLTDLKSPVAAAHAGAALVSTAGDIRHMPDYDGAIVRVRDGDVDIAYRGDAVALAVADGYLYALRGGPVVRHPQWARHQLIRIRLP